MFIEIAKKSDTANHYIWEDKQTFPLSQEALDALIYTLSFKESEQFIQKNTEEYFFTMTSNGFYSLYNKKELLLKSDLSLVQINGLRIMLEQAKIKTYGWN